MSEIRVLEQSMVAQELPLANGTWRHGSVRGTVVARCPECGRVMIEMAADIRPDGSIWLICPNMLCSFHGFVQLAGWAPAGQGNGQ